MSVHYVFHSSYKKKTSWRETEEKQVATTEETVKSDKISQLLWVNLKQREQSGEGPV